MRSTRSGRQGAAETPGEARPQDPRGRGGEHRRLGPRRGRGGVSTFLQMSFFYSFHFSIFIWFLRKFFFLYLKRTGKKTKEIKTGTITKKASWRSQGGRAGGPRGSSYGPHEPPEQQGLSAPGPGAASGTPNPERSPSPHTARGGHPQGDGGQGGYRKWGVTGSSQPQASWRGSPSSPGGQLQK